MDHSDSVVSSVVVATYNQSEFLRQCLDSLLNQTIDRAEYEIIVVDDGSDDDTPEILREYGDEIDTRLAHSRRKGLVPACTTGLEQAGGRYIIRVDSDDWLHASALENLLGATVANADADIIIPEYWVVEGGQSEVVRPDLGNVFTWMAAGPLLRREAVEQVGGYREFYWEEYDLYLRMLCRGARVIGIGSPVMYHREHSASITASEDDRRHGWRELAEAWSSSTLCKYGSHQELSGCRNQP